MRRMAMSREYLLWAAALLVERDYGTDGRVFLEAMIDDLLLKDDIKGVEMWLRVAERLEALSSRAAFDQH